jgi:hypothetical protein
MLRSLSLAFSFFALSSFVAACAADSASAEDDDVVVDTKSRTARAQYDANVAFASAYRAKCAPGTSGRPRVVVSGYGRFLDIRNNATGRIVSALVPSARYPETSPPAAGQIDPPETQLSVGTATIDVPGVGAVDVCGLVLPVYWDLAAIVLAKEVESFRPSFVMMNGVAGPRQPIFLELGAANKAMALQDGSSQLVPVKDLGPLVDGGPEGQANLLSWNAVSRAAREAVALHANEFDGGVRFGDVLQGVTFAGFPRSSNTYLCNNIVYTTGWLMNNPGRTTKLLRASKTERGRMNEIVFGLRNDFRATPRVFVHWPSEMDVRHHFAGADVMKAIIGAQLRASSAGDRPTFGDNANADPTLKGGDFF